MTAFATTNVVFYNFFLDIPVKIFATHLLLMTIFIILPDAKALFSFFWLHRPAALSEVWVPPMTRIGFRRATAVFEATFLFCAALTSVQFAQSIRAEQKKAEQPISAPLIGGWRVESSSTSPQSSAEPWTVLGSPVTTLYLNNAGTGDIQSADGQLRPVLLNFAPEEQKIPVTVMWVNSPTSRVYTWAMPDDSHLILADRGSVNATRMIVRFSRITLPSEYLLLAHHVHLADHPPPF
jgi:hypothetical protein